MIREKLYHIRYGTATFGIITQRYSNIVIATAPIAGWAKGKNIAAVLRYFAKKSATITLMYIERII